MDTPTPPPAPQPMFYMWAVEDAQGHRQPLVIIQHGNGVPMQSTSLKHILSMQQHAQNAATQMQKVVRLYAYSGSVAAEMELAPEAKPMIEVVDKIPGLPKTLPGLPKKHLMS